MTGGTMFDPFPTFPLPPCNALGGPPMELPYVGLCAIPKHHTPDGRWHHDTADADAWRERVEGGDWAQPLAGYEDCDDGPAPLVTDGHYEGDPAPVIGWGESVKRNVSDYLRRREAIAAGEKDPGPGVGR